VNADDGEKGAGDTGRARVINLSDPGYGEDKNEVQGHNHSAAVSVIVVDAPPGGGPRLHKHPYEEVFVIQDGTATFTAGDETIKANGGQVVVVPGGVPHKFVNTGEGRLRQVDIHASDRFITEWLE
jgi:mannose-6-phosphate isomerase-like protein (cupin superfamily)